MARKLNEFENLVKLSGNY